MEQNRQRGRLNEAAARPARRRSARRGGRRANAGPSAFLRVFYAVGMCLVLAAIGHASYGFLVESPYFRVARVEVAGVSEPVKSEVRGLVEDLLARNNNLISLDMRLLNEVVSAHPRVRNARIERIYPDGIVIRASERFPAAVVVAGGFYLLDDEAFVMEKVKASKLRSHQLPYISGIPSEEIQVGEKIPGSAVTRALDLVRVLKDRNPDLYKRFSEVNAGKDPVSHLDNLTGILAGGMEVRFGDTNPIEKLPALEMFIRLMKEKSSDPFSMAYVDLRFKNQIVFMETPVALAKAAGVLDRVTGEEPAADPKKKDAKPGRDPGSDDRRDGNDAPAARRPAARGDSGDSARRAGSAYPSPTRTVPTNARPAQTSAAAQPPPAAAAPAQRPGLLRRMGGFLGLGAQQ